MKIPSPGSTLKKWEVLRMVLLALLAPAIGSAPPQDASADELVFYAYPSPKGIRWNSPRSLAWSAIFSELAVDPRFQKQHEIGHANIELSCDATANEPAAYEFTGMTSADNADMVGAVFKKKVGLGVLLTTFPGRMETPQEIQYDLPARYSAGRLAYLRFEISAGACRRTKQFLDEYRAHGDDQYYGLPLRPLYHEGGGCTAFATSVLSVAGLLDEQFTRSWFKTIRIPPYLIGDLETGSTIPVTRLLWGRASRHWATSSQPGTELGFWDPDEMYRWIRRAYWKNSETPAPGWVNEFRGAALGLAIDRSADPVPVGPIWRK